METQNYDFVIIPAFPRDSLTITGRFKPKRRPLQPPLEFTTIIDNFNEYPQMVLVPLPEEF